MVVMFEMIVITLMLVGILFGCVYAIFLLIGTYSAAPFVTTHRAVCRVMIELADIAPGMHVLEIGSGIGSISTEAAQHGAIVTGIELNPMLVLYARCRASWLHLADRVTFICGNFWNIPLSRQTDVVFVYLMPGALKKLLPKLQRELEPGTLIVSHAFRISELPCLKKEGNVFVYRLPA